MKVLAVSAGALALALPGAALAQVTQTYSYDANGRLTGVVTSGGGNTHTSTYAYDDASNRTARSQTGATTWASVSQLPIDQLLQPDEALTSPDGNYTFALRPSGRLELWPDEGAAASPSPSLVAMFQLSDDGQARFLPPHPAGASVSLRNDGQLALLDENGREVWTSGNTAQEGAAQ